MCYRTTLILILSIGLSSCCPSPCTCRWKNGKQTAECVNKDLLIIPEGIETDVQVLEFSGNNLRVIHRQKFLKLDLINLQRIHLSRCRITDVNEQAFKGLTNLIELDLSENQLDAIPSKAFKECTSLMRLILSRNPIKALQHNDFIYMSSLGTLEMSHCDVSRVHKDTFSTLYKLEKLLLDSNRLQTFSATLPDYIKEVQLQGNPWRCDCKLLLFQELLHKYTLPLTNEPLCATPPELSGRIIKHLHKNDLACPPVVSPTSLYIEIDEGDNVTLTCNVHAVPDAVINWYFDEKPLLNDSFTLHGDTNKHSELSVQSANADDAGTYVCDAQNVAGSTYANYTVKVLFNKESNVTLNVPFEYIVVLASAGVSLTLILIVIILSVLRKKRSKTNTLTLTQDSSKTSNFNSNSNSTTKLVTYDEVKSCAAQGVSDFSFCDHNPDVINGTEGVENVKGTSFRSCGYEYLRSVNECSLFIVQQDGELGSMRDCYRTLPGKRRKGGNFGGAVYRDAESLNRNAAIQPPYEHFGTNVRYTADGYPVKATNKCQQAPIIPSHPGSHKSSGEASTETQPGRMGAMSKSSCGRDIY